VRAAFKKNSLDNLSAVVVEFPWARAPLPVAAEVVDEVEEVIEEDENGPTAVDDDLDMFG